MTTTSASPESLIDFAAFALAEDDLRSLASLAPLWQASVAAECARCEPDAALQHFLELTDLLPGEIADPEWQQRWIRAWHELLGRGYGQVEILRWFFNIVEACEKTLLGGRDSVGRVLLSLVGTLRRSVIAAVTCVLEVDELAQQEAIGLPGELAALRFLRELLQGGRVVGLLSISLTNRDSFTYLDANDLQRLPATLARRMRRHLREEDRVFIGREGEWLVVLPDIKVMSQPTLAAAHIERMFGEPVPLFSGRKVMVRPTIGAALLPQHGASAETALHAARLARWGAQGRRQAFAWFDAGFAESWQQRHELAEELREALFQETLELHLQPQNDLADGRCIGGELLLRWRHERTGWVPPPLIMEMIEENGWRLMFNDWLLRAVMRAAAELEKAGIGIGLSFNLTAADMLDDDLPEFLEQNLLTWRIPGERFTLELTESALMFDRAKGSSIMHRLRKLGCRIALDDFGTGYSSLSYLVSLPLNELKVDRSFVVAMLDSPDSLRVVSTIVDLARDLGMMPLAEGIEDEAQRDQLLALGCVAGQGYFYGKPMTIDEFIVWYHGEQQH